MQQKRARQIFVLLLTGYKYLISPLLPSACRFHPTCSEYMREAIEMHGVGRGIWMGLKRLSRCHPFHEGGCDPVPPPTSNVSSGAPRPLDYSAAEGEPAPRLAAR